MSSVFKSNRWTSSISAAAITVVGILGSATSPAVAQTQNACNRSTASFNSGTDPLPSPIRPTGTISSISGISNSVRIQTAARNAALALYPNSSTPNPLFTRYDTENEGAAVGIVYEFRGRQSNGCQLEVDVRQRNPVGTQYRVEEIEQQLPVGRQSTLSSLPSAVRNRLRSAGFTAARFQVVFIERSIRPQPARPVPPQGPPITVPVQTFYEIEGGCLSRVPGFCAAGQTGEATINSSGTAFEFEVSED